MKLSKMIFFQILIYGLSITSCYNAIGQDMSANLKTQTIRLSAAELERRAVKRVVPKFPPEVTAAWIQSTTQKLIVEVMLDKRGRVIQAKAISGVSLLRPFAVEAAKQWEFESKAEATNVLLVGYIIFPTPLEIYGMDLRDVNYYKNIVSQSPNSWIAQCLLAKALGEKKSYQQAIEAYNKALLLKPDAAIALYGLGRSYCPSQRQCERNKALESYRKATQLQPDFIEAWFGVAWMHDTPKMVQDAPQVWKQILTKHSDLGTRTIAYRNLVSLYARLKKVEEEINAHKGLVQTKQEDLAITLDEQGRFGVAAELISLAGEYEEIGKYEDAIFHYQKAIELAPETQAEWEASFSMAGVYKKKGDQAGAMSVYQEMLAKVTDRAFKVKTSKEQRGRAYYTQGLVYEEMGRLNDALESYQSAIKERPDWIKPHVGLFYLYRKMGNQIAAV